MTLELNLEPGDAELFREESLELIDALESTLLELEAGAGTAASIDTAFRSAHTLKGSAATIGHGRLASLTHAMEDLLEVLRSDERGPVARIVAELLAAIDIVRLLVDEVRAGTTLTDDADAMRTRLTDLHAEVAGRSPVAGDGPRPVTGTAHGPILAGAAPGLLDADVILVCRILPTSEWRAVRMLQLVMEADASGRLLGSEPDLASIEADHVGDELLLYLSRHDDTTAIARQLEAIEDVVAVERRTANPPAADAADALDAADAPAVMSAPFPAVSPAAPADDRAGSGGIGARTTIRVDVARLDDLMNLVGELVVQKTQFEGFAARARAALGDDPLAIESEEAARQFAAIGGQIHDSVTRLRMLPVSTVFDALPRMARDVASRLDREVALAIDGGDVELDRAILEGLGGLLNHVVRNAIDHGIESPDERVRAGKPRAGRIAVSATQSEGRVSIVIDDDGRGVDAAAVRRAAIERGVAADMAIDRLRDEDAIDLLFRPGFSTATAISDISGRGVGLDVVRTDVSRLGGSVALTSILGSGTKVTLSLPLTLAIVRALLVRSSDSTYAIPMTGISESFRADSTSIRSVAGRPTVVLRGRVIEVIPLSAALAGAEWPSRVTTALSLVVIRTPFGELALAVDSLLGHQDIVIKRIEAYARPAAGIAGATILPDGGVALVVDVQTIARPAATPPRLSRTA
jgi:two-component system chemotaxis sensor kinase CheA